MKTFFGIMVGVCCLAVAPAVPAQEPDVAAVDTRQSADELVARLFSVFQNYDRLVFDALVSPDFIPDRSEFLNRTEENARAGQILGMEHFLNEVMTADNRLIAAFRWEKSSIPAGSPGPILLGGQAEAVFVRTDDVWLLEKLTGDSPF